jgi:2-phosphosulfolactate phosphatase
VPTTQQHFGLRFGWGEEDLHRLAPVSEAVVIVDVLRFTTAVSVAVTRGATVFPYPWRDAGAAAFAAEHDAQLAGTREDPATPWSLSPTDLTTLPSGTRLVLPSPNGSALSAAAGSLAPRVLAGCLRNAAAVAEHLRDAATVSVVAAGERWPGEGGAHTGPLRPAVEDLLGAGAVLSQLAGLTAVPLSPEARAAVAAFEAVRDLDRELRESASGQELLGRGWGDDVAAAAALDADAAAPVLRDGGYVAG